MAAAAAAFKKLQPEDFHRAHIDQGKRADGRSSLAAIRPVSISVGNIGTADGSSIVKQGETSVVCGVKLELATPKPESPEEGFVVPNMELGPLCHPQFKPGPPSEMAQTVSQFVYQALKNSAFLDPKDLCVEKAKLVWAVYVDLVCLNFGGNVLDVALKAAVAALRNTTMPKVQVVRSSGGRKADNDDDEEDDGQEEKEIEVDLIGPRKCLPLSQRPPLSCTIAVFDQDKLLVDPTEDEEKLSSGTITVAVQLPSEGVDAGNEADSVAESKVEICHFDKPGGAAISRETVQKCCLLAKKQARQIKKLIDAATTTGSR